MAGVYNALPVLLVVCLMLSLSLPSKTNGSVPQVVGGTLRIGVESCTPAIVESDPGGTVESMFVDWQKGDLDRLFAYQEASPEWSLPCFVGHMILPNSGRFALVARPQGSHIVRVEPIAQDQARVHWAGTVVIGSPPLEEANTGAFPFSVKIPGARPLDVSYGDMTLHLQSPLLVIRQQGAWRVRDLFTFANPIRAGTGKQPSEDREGGPGLPP